MRGTYILIIIIIILVGGIIVIDHYKETKGKPEQFNVSISAEYNRKLIKTGIEIGDQKINTSNTYEIIKLDKGIIKIKNINIEDQNFYENEIEVNISGNTRIDLVLERAELPTIKVKDNGTITLILESDNFKEVDFCLIGSYNYIFLKAPDFKEVKKFEGFENYDICYDGGFSLDGNKKEIEIEYTQFTEPSENDYINISLIDKANNVKKERIK